MENFTPNGTPVASTVCGTTGDTYETDVYPSNVSGLGLCKPQDPRRVAEWCVVHRGSGAMIVMCRTGHDAFYAASALAFAASSVGCFWEHDLNTVTGNAEAMRHCAEAARVYAAR